MRISTNTSILSNTMPTADAVKILAECGFSALDLSLCNITDSDLQKLYGDYKAFAKEIKNVANGAGVTFNQSHAPFHSSYIEDELTQKAYTEICRAMEFAALVDVKNIVVHPKQHLEYPEEAKVLKEMNLEFYNSLIPLCKEYGINVLVENMWHYREGHIIGSVCADPQEFCEYVDMLNSPYIKACFDIGHAELVKADIPNFINSLGDRLHGLHVHDVSVDNDLHTVPYFGAIKNWDNIMKALADISYKGDLTFEVKSLKNLPYDLVKPRLQLLHLVGEELVKKFEAFKYKGTLNVDCEIF